MEHTYFSPTPIVQPPIDNNSGQKHAECPAEIKGWSWGAFLLSWIWAIGNKTWIGLLAIVPIIGFFVAIGLGFKGRELAWKNKQWQSIEHFNEVQRKWSIWAITICLGFFFFGMISALMVPSI